LASKASSVDACPCALADRQECKKCSILNGKLFCGHDCDWPGFCIFEWYQWRSGPWSEAGGDSACRLEAGAGYV